MSFAYTTYKTPNAINKIGQDLTGSEGCGVYLKDQAYVDLATSTTDIPYGVVVVGAASVDGTYAGTVAQSSLELVDALGCVVQVKASTAGLIGAGEFVLIDTQDANGTFVSTGNQAPATGDWVWGLALTDCAANEQFVMRLQPYIAA